MAASRATRGARFYDIRPEYGATATIVAEYLFLSELEIDRRDATALVYLARAEARRGNTAEARRAYAAVLERVPDHIEAGAFLVGSSN